MDDAQAFIKRAKRLVLYVFAVTLIIAQAFNSL